MRISTNYGLKLMEGTDNVKRQDFVDNFTKIDTEMKTINDNGYPNVTATGTNAYVGSTDRIKFLGKGTKLTLFVGTDSTGNCTLNLNSYGVKNIKDSFGNIVTNLKANIPYNICYNGTDFILQGKGGGGDATSNQVLNGKKATVDSGPIVGTMPNNGALNYNIPINGSYTIPVGYTTGGKVTQNIPIKAAATINPSTVAQTVAAGQYLSGNQTIAPITGTATDTDVVAGKTYNSAAGILRTGAATIESLGGRRYADIVVNHTKDTAQTITYPFKANIARCGVRSVCLPEYNYWFYIIDSNNYRQDGFRSTSTSLIVDGYLETGTYHVYIWE